MEKRLILFSLFMMMNLIFIVLVNASYTLGNESYNVGITYGPNELVNGWINISFDNEKGSSVLSVFDQNITVKEFLDLNSANYSCFPGSCKSGYSSSGAGTLSKSLNIPYSNSEVIGVKLVGNINSVDSFSFDIVTNAGASCLQPLKIDILDDGNYEWTSLDISNDYSCLLPDNYGCYKSNEFSGDTSLITINQYCEKIKIFPGGRSFEIGVEIIKVDSGSGNVDFALDITTDNYYDSCTFSAGSTGKYKCKVKFDYALEEKVEATVCINTKDSDDNGKFEINYERVDACGSAGGEDFDFPIFVNPGKYASVSNLAFNANLYDASGIITEYIISTYGGVCEPECIIPIKFESGINQDLTISNLNLIYSAGISKSEKMIYNVFKSEVVVDSDFEKLDLSVANFLTPNDKGKEYIVLKLNDDKLFEEEIKIINVPVILNITPSVVPSLVAVKYLAFLDTPSNSTFTWDFGDGTIKETLFNSVVYTYSNVGEYELKLTIFNNIGNSSKTVNITVESPKGFINQTINKYNKNLEDIESKLRLLSSLVRGEIEKVLDIDSLRTDIRIQKTKYDSTLADDDATYIEIMTDLLALNVPESINISKRLNPSRVFLDSNQINIEALESMGAGSSSSDIDNYDESIVQWFINNIEMTIETKTYSIYYGDGDSELFTYVKATLSSSNKLGPIYFMVNSIGDSDKIIFDSRGKKDLGNSVGVVITELSGFEVIEFIYPESFNIDSIPIYVSPDFIDLDLEIEVSVCNINGKCEKGENTRNCSVDCGRMSLEWIIFWFVIAFIFSLVLYIIVQEWYKRNYEHHLFKDRNFLFNLINFISLSANQGLKKGQIFSKLRKTGWNHEQLVFAWKRFKGKRTGMLEIPIFKSKERKEVRRELAKRRGVVG